MKKRSSGESRNPADRKERAERVFLRRLRERLAVGMEDFLENIRAAKPNSELDRLSRDSMDRVTGPNPDNWRRVYQAAPLSSMTRALAAARIDQASSG